ncbi:CNH domain-containing protein [Panaeolus papilionaceus]|nr:CNH domain-containing protein [Panaeolus papilionaceus]
MASSSKQGLHRTLIAEEDLQRLYDEIWAEFAEEPVQQEADLDGIYNGYADDRSSVHSSNPANYGQVSESQHSSRVKRPSPIVETGVDPVTSPVKSPAGRRRLPPTPGAQTSSFSVPMPEPEPYSPYGGSRANHYTSSSHASYSDISNTLADQGRATPSGMSNGTSRPHAAHNNAYSSMDGSDRTTESSHGYLSSQGSSHLGSSSSIGSYSTSNTTAEDAYYRPPGASPPHLPPKPAVYREQQNSSYSAYTHEPSSAKFTPPPPPPPPPPKAYAEPNPYLESKTLTTTPLSDSDFPQFSDFNLKPENRPTLFSFESDLIASEAGPSRGQPVQDDRDQDEDWDPSSYMYDQADYEDGYDQAGPSHANRDSIVDPRQSIAVYSQEEPTVQDTQDDYWEDIDEDESLFINFSLLSHIAVQLRDKIEPKMHVKGSVSYPRSFTGRDIVSTIQSQIQRELAINHGLSTSDRRVALQIARSLHSQLFICEVEWDSIVLQDGVEDLYLFNEILEQEELPTGVITMMTRCYSPSCGEGTPCYSFSCPRKGNFDLGLPPIASDTFIVSKDEEWTKTIDPLALSALTKEELHRQNVIHGLIAGEQRYLKDLDLLETVFIRPLRNANPPVVAPNLLDDFIDDIFGNILDLRECNRRLLEVLIVRQREEGPVILRIGDIFLEAAMEFKYAYPEYLGHYPISEKRLAEAIESNPAFNAFLEKCSQTMVSLNPTLPPLELKAFLERPGDHLRSYPQSLEEVLKNTEPGNGDGEFVRQAIDAIRNLQSIAQLRTFQAAMGKGTPGKWEWHDLVAPEVRAKMTKKQAKRQAVIFELIKGEMAYVKDLENMLYIYILPLRKAQPPIISPDRVDRFIDEVFHNYNELYEYHKKLVDKLHEIQREQHPEIHSITAPLYDAALHFHDAYMEYIPNYPIAAYRIDDEMVTNLSFKSFVDQCVRHPDAHRLDMKNFINRPIPRLLRYELLLKGIMDETEPGHEDLDTIPNLIDVIKALGKESEPGVHAAKQKVEVWRYNTSLVFKPGEYIDMDLLDSSRSLIYSGKLLRQPDSGLEWNGWSELHVLLFDNYLVMTKPKEKDGITRYIVNRRPIPLDLLTLVGFSDPPTQRSTGILKTLRVGERHEGNAAPGLSPESATDSRHVFPLTLHHNGRMGGPYILYAESSQIRSEWKEKLDHALTMRKVVQENNKVFEIEYLSRDTFIMPSIPINNSNHSGPAWNQDSQFTGKVTCSVPFNTPDGRALVAIGCTEGVWIGFRHDPKSIRRVLHLKMVTQCAMLEDFGIFLVLADKALFAYHIEALVPSSPHGAHTSQVPQKLSGAKDVHFFSVGTLHGRTLIVYMKKKGLDSIFRVLEPVNDKINERVKAPLGLGSRLGFRSAKSEWFRVYRDFFLPSDSFDVIFLKARIAIFCAKGFEIMNLGDFESITIPQREDPKHAQLAKRCESCRPLGMFRSTDDEFLLCYDEFGLYVDKHGDPCRTSGTIEWEGTAERVAFHSPYILLFDSRFIEIRHIQTGRLAQIIPGTDIRCTWDGRGVSNPQVAPPVDPEESGFQDAQVHFVMNSMDSVPGPASMRQRNVLQHVCELIPTVPLFPVSGPNAPPPVVPTGGGPHQQVHPVRMDTGYSSISSNSPSMQTPMHTYASTPSLAGSYGFPASGSNGNSPLYPQGYSPAPAPNVNPIPGGPYYGRTPSYAANSPPRSPDPYPGHSGWKP